MWNSKGYSAINIIGLAAGLATCLMIFLFVLDEINYDRYNLKAGRIYRVDTDLRFGGNHFILAVTSDPMGPALKKEFPQVEQQVRFRSYYGGIRIKKGEEWIREERVISADSTLLDVFTLPMTEGNPRSALVAPNSIVITEAMAKKYFNTTHVVGKEMLVNNDNFKVTGVIKDIPLQSHFSFDFFLPLAASGESRENNWISNNFNTYIVLKEGADPAKLESQLDAFAERYIGPQVKSVMNMNLDELKKSGNWIRYSLMPLTRIHLYSDKESEFRPNGSIRDIYIFSAIAGFILLIACVNFMNLSTARSASRTREVGIRKVLGSLRIQLIYQFLSESVLITFIALLIALGMVMLLLPFFNHLSEKELVASSMARPWFLAVLIPLVLLVGFIAGSYPAFYLSSFRPISILKGKLAANFKSGWLRSGLVIFQFTISVILIVGTVVIQSQLTYIRNKKPGFDRSHVLVIQNPYVLGKHAVTFREQVLNISGVQGATLSGYLPTGNSRTDSPLFPDASRNQKTAVSMQIWKVDEHYIPTLGMQMSRGRNFSPQLASDSSGIIINEAAARMLGFGDPLNKPLYYMNSLTKNDVQAYHIVGVVKDFNFNSMRQHVTPLALFLQPDWGSIALRVQSTDMSSLIDQIRHQWKALSPDQPFSFSFMDDDFNSIYKAEQRVGRIALIFSILAIFIACLGLFGLVTYAAEQRTKEIGIRKVLGASVSSIVNMLSKDFLKLVFVSLFLAFPLAWWWMNRWLQDFAYRIRISWWIFAAAGSLAILIALLTVSFQALKAAWMNPVKSLRTE